MEEVRIGVLVYRGVHAIHLDLPAALKGTVNPGDPSSDMTAEEHNLFDESAASCFTSWSYSLEVARRFARRRGPGGVVLRTIASEPDESEAWSWHASPDFHREKELLLRGRRIGLEVFEHV